MSKTKPEQTSSEVSAPPACSNSVPRDMDEEMKTPTPREQNLADLAEKNKSVAPQRYDITSKNAKALRVVHDYQGRTVAIQPGQTKQGVMLHPNVVEHLKRAGSDLELSPST